MNRSGRWSSILGLAAAGAALATFPTCSGTKHTVARIVTPAARPTEVFVPAPAEAPAPPATRVPQAVPPTPPPTPTVVSMPIVTTPRAPSEQSPGVLYEQRVPTAVPATPLPTRPATPVPAPPATRVPTAPDMAVPEPTATRAPTPRSVYVPRVTATPKARAQKPGAYYEDEEGRPLPTPTPAT